LRDPLLGLDHHHHAEAVGDDRAQCSWGQGGREGGKETRREDGTGRRRREWIYQGGIKREWSSLLFALRIFICDPAVPLS
jgi:hypothetical protein